jgi:hypothetical protein
MKKVLVLGMLLISGLSIAQTKKISIADVTIDKIDVKYIKDVNLSTNESKYYSYLAFQNQEYSSIIDSQIIGFFKQSELDEFITDLKAVEKQMLTKEKVNVNWTKHNYGLDLYDFNSNYVYLRNLRNGHNGYTTITLKSLTKIIEKLSTIEIGKDDLKTL